MLGQSFNRLPLESGAEVKKYIEERQSLHHWHVEINQETAQNIYNLTGGNLRLVKRVVNIIESQLDSPANALEPKQLLINPEMALVLSEIVQYYPALSEEALCKLGFTAANLKIHGQLIEKYLEKIDLPKKEKLPEKQRVLFNLLYENRGELVTMEQIDDCLRGKFDSSTWANYKLISRLKSALKGRYQISTVNGKGYILTQVN